LPLAAFAVNHKGCGDEQYPPHTMLALLIYCYANGIFSSRRIERATYRDVAVRYLTADTHPDHDTICAFRRNNLQAIAVSFVDVLELARELKLLQLGTVSLDGTHIRASASKDKNLTTNAPNSCARTAAGRPSTPATSRKRRPEGRGSAAAAQEIARREQLLQKMDAACAQTGGPAQARAAAERADYERKVAARSARRFRQRPGTQAAAGDAAPDEQINLTDPDARLMRKSKREGYTQSYNAQAVVAAGAAS